MKSFNEYEKVSIATDVVILTTANKPQDNKRMVPEKGLQILLVKRDEEPYKNTWSLPGGFVNVSDGISDCVHRKLTEKTGLKYIYMEQLFTYGDDVNRDPRGRVISVSYLALAQKEKLEIHADEASKETAWFWVLPKRNKNEITEIEFIPVDSRLGTTPIANLAFDHEKIVKDALIRLQNKIEYTGIVFHLVNEKFTVKELQLVYEAIQGHLIQSFRRKMGERIIQTDELTDGVAHRPARLFKFNRRFFYE
jgi:ADP-ribose pyrophosphatase YjhB (NUDIX family)